MPEPSHFDYIIIGNGLAGFQLALKFSEDPFFADKQIGLIDPSKKEDNDKTWSFWQKDSQQWDPIIHKSWRKASIKSAKKTINLNLAPYTYNSIRAIDFYAHAKSILQSKPNFHFIIDTVEELEGNDIVKVRTRNRSLTASHVFDSRIPDEYASTKNKSISIIQHFKGWIIKTDDNMFDEDNVVMMDYRLKDGEQTTFMYVLPFSSNEALVEFTYFTDSLVSEDVYDQHLKQYIKDYLNIESYEIQETEMGQIPMTTFDFSKYNSDLITKIGTGGGWVKGSTGYSFKLTEKKVGKLMENLKSGQVPSSKLFKRKYRFYDKIFLKVLKDENHKGEWIFTQFYSKNSA